MRLIGGIFIANNISFGSVTNGEHFLLATLDWRDFDFKMQVEICDAMGYGYYRDELVNDDFSVSLVVPRVKGMLNFDLCYLHILTIGMVLTEDIKKLVKSQIELVLDPYSDLLRVELSPYEKFDILNRIIQPTDMRKVV